MEALSAARSRNNLRVRDGGTHMNASAKSLVLMLTGCCSLAAAAAPISYELQTIDPGVTGFYVTDLNNKGEVIGVQEDPLNGPVNSFVWRNGETREVTSPLGYSALLVGINDRSEILGTYIDAEGQANSFIWHRGRSVPLDDEDGFNAYDLNDRRRVIGADYDPETGLSYFVWKRGQRVPLEPLPDYASMSFAPGGAINNRGAVVGSGYSEGVRVAAIWQHGEVMPLSLPPDAVRAEGWDITDRGTVLAHASYLHPDGTASSGAYIWRSGEIIQLGSPADLYEYVDAQSINEKEIVVGRSYNIGSPPYDSVATVWYRGRAVDLNARIADGDPLKPYVVLDGAHFINDRGQIVATGTDSRDPSRSAIYFLLTPRRNPAE
jgi:hypothetical protein